MRDPYSILGVSKNSSDEDIKKSYRKLAKKYHPDLNPGNKDVEKRFKELTQAYDIVGDPAKRKKFDAGMIDAEGNERGFYRGGASTAGGKRGADPFSGFDPQDIFADFFNAAKKKASGGFADFEDQFRGGGKTQGADINYSLQLPFLDAVRGTKRRISLNNDGKNIEISIPAGTTDGQVLRLKGQGKAGSGGGARGDAFVEIHVDPDPNFELKGMNIYTDLPVTLNEAVMGATITVPTIDGKVSMNIPKNSNTGTSLRLKGKGVVDASTKIRGDQYVRLHVMLPEKMDKKFRDFIEDWCEKNPYKVRKDSD